MKNPLDEILEEEGYNPVDDLFKAEGLNPVDQLFSEGDSSSGGSPVLQYLPELERMVSEPSPVTKSLKNVLSTAGSGAMKVLELLDRPRSTVVAGIQALTGDRGADSVRQALSGEYHPSWGELMPDEIWVPQYEHGGVLGWKTGSRGGLNVKPALALAADLVVDPINLLGAGGLTKAGESAKVLSNIIKTYGGDIARTIKSKSLDDVARAVREMNPKVVKLLRKKGVSEELLKQAAGTTDVLKGSLADQAKAGQWAALRYGTYRTPQAFNEAVARILENTKRKLPDVPIINKFITGTGDDAYDRAYEAVVQKHREKMQEILDKGAELRAKLGDAAEDTFSGRSSMGWYERGGTGEIADLAEDIITPQLTEMERMKRRGLDLGIRPIQEEGYRYAPHVMVEESIGDKIRRAFRSKKPTIYTPHKLQRDIVWIRDPMTGKEFLGSLSGTAKDYGLDIKELIYRQADVDEINDWFKSLDPKNGKKILFKPNLASSMVAGAVDNEIALHGARQLDFFLTSAKRELASVGGLDEAMKLGWRTPTLRKPERYLLVNGKQVPIRSKIEVLEKIPMPKAKARFIESKWKEIVAPDETAAGLKKLFNGYTSLWKRYTLFPFAEYHMRNMVGDIWNGWLNGWKPTEIVGDLVEAAKMQMIGKDVSFLGTKFHPFKGGESVLVKSDLYGAVPANKVLREAQMRGVVGTGQYGDMRNMFTKLTSEQGENFVKRELYNLETAMRFGTFLEDNRRLALFARQLKNGETFEDAARIVKRTLYDYSDLTDLEKGFRRWGIPFYSWYRKNIPAQFRHLLKYPGKVATLPKVKAHVEGQNDRQVAEEMRPEWMRREFSIHLGADDQGNEEFVTLGSFLPTADLFRFGGSPEDFLTGVLSNTNPAWKVPFELAINKNTFFDRPVDRLRDEDASPWEKGGELFGNERTNYLGMNLPTTAVKMTEMLPFTRLLSTLDRMNPFGIFNAGENPDGTPYEPGVVREGQIKTRPYHTELDTLSKLVKSLFGLKVYPADVERSALYSMRDKVFQGGRASGFNKAALQSAMQYALAEGDLKSVEIYSRMLDRLLDKLDVEQEMLEEYLGDR